MATEIDSQEVIGYDVHPKYQPWADWQALAKEDDRRKFVIIKVSEGYGYEAERYPEYHRDVKEAGMYPSGYHFHYANDNWKSQANYFLERFIPDVLPPVFDFEDTKSSYSYDRVANDALKWLEYVTVEIGKKPILYTGKWYMDRIPAHYYDDFAKYKLWIASYSYSEAVDYGYAPTMPDGFNDFLWHQFSSKFTSEHVKKAWLGPNGKWYPFGSTNMDVNKTSTKKWNELLGIVEPDPPVPPVGKTYEDAYGEMQGFIDSMI